MTDLSSVNLKLSVFAQNLIPEGQQLYCKKLRELGCVDPLFFPLQVFKRGNKKLNKKKCPLLLYVTI